jgi:hypothetical protein
VCDIDDCVKQEQAKLTASQARLSEDITLLHTDVKTMINNSLKTQNERMQGFIRDAIVANTKSMTASTTAPFATKKEIMTLFADFKQDLRSMIPAAPSMMPMQHRSPPHPGYQYHHYPPNYPLQLQHQASPHDTPVRSPANKKARARATETHVRQTPQMSLNMMATPWNSLAMIIPNMALNLRCTITLTLTKLRARRFR